MVKRLVGITAVWLVLTSYGVGDVADAMHNWPQWRGPLSTGVALHANPPVEWSEDRNIRWKLALSGGGHSTPIVWGDRVFVTMAEPFGEVLEPKYSDAPGAHGNFPVTQFHKFVVLAVSRWEPHRCRGHPPGLGHVLQRQPQRHLDRHPRPRRSFQSQSKWQNYQYLFHRWKTGHTGHAGLFRLQIRRHQPHPIPGPGTRPLQHQRQRRLPRPPVD